MVSLRPLQSHDVGPETVRLDPGWPDDDLVIALPTGAALDKESAEVVAVLAEKDPADGWFGDIEVAGRTTLRGAWSPTRLLTDPGAATPLAVRVGWLRAHALDAGDPDLPLRMVEADATVAHVPVVLTRHLEPPPGPSHEQLANHLERRGISADLDDQGRVVPSSGFAPPVSVVIPTAGARLEDGTPALARLLDGLRPIPDRLELVIVVGDEYQGDPDELQGPGRIVVHRPPGPFNFSAAINLGALHARSDLLLLLNDDTEPDGPAFIDVMAMHLTDPTVAAVGALLTYPDGTVQHAGVVIDDARPLHPFVGWDRAALDAVGGRVARDLAAVTGACLMVRRADFLAVGGLSVSFPLSFNDIDLCVRLRRAVGRIVFEPAATLVHHETLTREPTTTPEEWDRWIHRWGEIIDPWYHPGFHRPDDPHALARNADHLPAEPGDPPFVPVARHPVLRSRVHRGRPDPDRADLSSRRARVRRSSRSVRP